MEVAAGGAALRLPPGSRRAVGALIRSWRLARTLSQHDLAARSGVSQGLISHIETGRRTATLDDMRLLAKPLGLPLIELLRASGLVGEDDLEEAYGADLTAFVLKLRQDAEVLGALGAIRRSPHAEAALDDIAVGLRRHLVAIAREQRAREARSEEGQG